MEYHGDVSDSDDTYDPTETDGCPGSPITQRLADVQGQSSVHGPSTSKPQKLSNSSSMRQTHVLSDSDSDDASFSKTSPASVRYSGKSTENLSPQRSDSVTQVRKTPPRSKNSVAQFSRSDTAEIKQKTEPDKSRPPCRYGLKCYRKNPSHFEEFSHPRNHSSQLKRKAESCGEASPNRKQQKLQSTLDGSNHKSSENKNKITTKISDSCELNNGNQRYSASSPLHFFLLNVRGIRAEFNGRHSIGIRDILDSSMGTLQKSAQFNYMFDIPWLIEKYPAEFRKKPMLCVHGFQKQQKADIDLEASLYDHVTLCQARLDMPYGTHHTKMMFLLYDEGLRVVIHTANLIESDWSQRTQGAWLSPVFPPLSSATSTGGDSVTHFKRDLVQYLHAYRSRHLQEWIDIICKHDMSNARVFLVCSVPGRHIGENKSAYGHLKLRKILQDHGPSSESVKSWPVIGQFSSIGSLGAQPEAWLCGEWYTSLSSARGGGTAMGGNRERLKLIFPSKENVRQSLEGYPAGASLPYSINVAKKQTYLHSFFHQWKAGVRGRSRASPHIKTYTRMSADAQHLAWFLVTSANLSKAAWGALEKKGSQLMIRSYEIGVLFLPEQFGEKWFDVMKPSSDAEDSKQLMFPQPYDLPPVPYTKTDKPWIWDIAYTDLPDSHGNAWCPR